MAMSDTLQVPIVEQASEVMGAVWRNTTATTMNVHALGSGGMCLVRIFRLIVLSPQDELDSRFWTK